MDNFASRHVPELDGLRGIAIISVLIHHQLTPFALKGGFLGVDLFFVLSGFLITGLLSAEFNKTNSISLKKFYMRRILRLGPALVLYLFGCLIVTIYTQEISVTRQIKLIVLALVYSTNWRMAFQWDTALDPTAIIWSLSIEEQFYLVWPIVLFVCLGLKIKRNHIAAALAAVIIAILIHRFVMLSGGAVLTRLYYGTDTRADALLMGCLFALLPGANLLSRGKRWLNLAGLLSAACFIFLMFTVGFTDRLLYQGGFTLRGFAVRTIDFCSGILSTQDTDRITKFAAVAMVWPNFLWLISLALASGEKHNLLLPWRFGAMGQAESRGGDRGSFLLHSRMAVQ